MGLGGAEETRLTTVLEAGIREVDGGHWHYRDLQDASRETELSQGFRYLTLSLSSCATDSLLPLGCVLSELSLA